MAASRSERILLTGATGFVGRHLLARLQRTEAELYATGRRRPSTALKRGTFVTCDLASPESQGVLRLVQPDVVVHLAGFMPPASPPQECLEENLAANMLGLSNLLRCCRSAKYFVYLSTTDVYGPPAHLPLDEEHRTRPVTYYAVTKLAAENILQVHCRNAGMALLVFRLAHTYGPGEPTIKLIPQAIARVAAGQAPVLYGDGSDLRDYIHVKDVVETIVRALAVRPTGTLNLASGTSRSAAEVIDTVLRVSGLEAAPIRLPRDRPCVHLAFNVSRLRQALGDVRTRDFADGIREQYEYYVRSGRRQYQANPDVLEEHNEPALPPGGTGNSGGAPAASRT